MKWFFKWTFRLLLLLIVLAVALVVFRDAIFRGVAERQIRQQTGMAAEIGQFHLGLLSPVFRIQNLKIYNPPEFGGMVFLDIPELHVEYKWRDLMYRELHITLLRLNLAELNIVRNQAGRTNLVAVSAKPAAPRGQREPDLDFKGIDVLNLSVGRVRYVDLQNPAASRELRLDLDNRIVKDVRTRADFNGLLLLLWLRSGGNLSGQPMPAPPEVIPLPGNSPP